MNQSYLLATVLLSFPLFAFAGKNPSDYPLKVHILQQNWSSHNNYRNEFKGTGRGNVWEGDAVYAFDYSYECSFGVRRTARNQPYPAKWKQAQLRLAVLAPEIGKNDKYQECTLKTTVHDGVYVIGGGGISELSQENYKNWKAKRETDEAGQRGAAGEISKLSISSTPNGAEIAVDGEFMGDTPSVLELPPGEHWISFKKDGYKLLKIKLKLVPGETTLNPQLPLADTWSSNTN